MSELSKGFIGYHCLASVQIFNVATLVVYEIHYKSQRNS